MSDDLKLPADERAREALDAYMKAVVLYARRRELCGRRRARRGSYVWRRAGA